MDEPYLMDGGIFINEHGIIRHVNEFTFDGVGRFCIIENHEVYRPRPFHAHEHEAKYMMAAEGTVLAIAVRMDFEKDTWVAPHFRFILSDQNPQVLYIPKGFANSHMSLVVPSKVLLFSTATWETANDMDDYHYSAYDLGDNIWVTDD